MIDILPQGFQAIRDIVYLAILAILTWAFGQSIDLGGEMWRHYGLRGTFFPVLNGETVWPEVFPR